jgi:signal transduction histidine kinase
MPRALVSGTRGKAVSETDFVTLTAREMQIPANLLKWNVERLERVLGARKEDETIKRIFGRLKEATERITRLVEDLQLLATLEKGRFTIRRRIADVSELIRHVVSKYEEEAARRGIELTWSVEGSLPVVRIDALRTEQVIDNLVSNAIKYTPRGGKVMITAHHSRDIAPPLARPKQYKPNPRGYVVVTVEDTGIGIPPEEQDKIFKRFFRGAGAVKTETGGTGLGLFLVKTIVELQEGAVWFRSAVGQGSAFSFSVPVA